MVLFGYFCVWHIQPLYSGDVFRHEHEGKSQRPRRRRSAFYDREMATSVVEPTVSDDGSTVKGRILALPTVSSQTLLVASLCFATLLVSGVHTILLVLIRVGVLIYCTVIVFNIRRRSSSRRSEVLLVGPCDSGKTAILTTVRTPAH